LPSFAVEISDLLYGQASIFDNNQRKELADKMSKLFEMLDHSFPSLKPSEQKWVDEEREAIASIINKDTRGKRFLDLERSVEFQQDKMKRLVKAIRNALIGVIQAEDLAKEIYCWSVASFFLTEKETFDLGIAILLKDKKLQEKGLSYFGGAHIGYGYFYNRFGRAIQEFFVIPYLANSLKK